MTVTVPQLFLFFFLSTHLFHFFQLRDLKVSMAETEKLLRIADEKEIMMTEEMYVRVGLFFASVRLCCVMQRSPDSGCMVVYTSLQLHFSRN